MNERTADPARTHALLVGVEKYNAGKHWSLNGPAHDVLGFRAWLQSCKVAEDRISSVVSAIDENIPALEAAGVTAKPATSTNVRNALNDLHDKGGDLLFVFWSGHGIIGVDQQRRLFFSDASEADKQNLDLEALLRSLRSTYFVGFSRQIVVVDACSNYEKDMQWAFQSPGLQIATGVPRSGYEQFVLLAARDGQVAKNLGKEHRGLFSRELLNELNRLGGSWPPEMRDVADRVRNRLAANAGPNETAQVPVYGWHRDWEGSETIYSIHRPASNIPSWKLSLTQLRRLTDALLACKAMKNPQVRDDVIALMIPEISSRVDRRADAASDVLNIIQTAASYPGGIESLLEAVGFFENGSHAYAAAQAVFAGCFPALAPAGPRL